MHTFGMFTELLQAELWRKKLEAAGYRVLPEAWPPRDEFRDGPPPLKLPPAPPQPSP
jgi:hypothetical protein